MNTIHYLEHPSPVGPLRIAASADGLVALYMQGQRHRPAEVDPAWRPVDAESAASSTLDETRRQLDDYFAGRRTTFALPLATTGTVFQQAVWAALRDIGYGRTISYGELARRIGRPAAVRAVGLANGRNPVSIVVPCHRVIGADGSMTGYGGGVERKIHLLALEAAHPNACASAACSGF
jgi:methylated-DNA-[protein]-cysteine S-methyltransferase